MGWKPINISDKELKEFELMFKKRCKFLVDENLGIEVAKLLKENGWNVKYVSELGLIGRSDEDIFSAAYAEDRVILTHDKDYLNDSRFPPHRNPGLPG